MSKKQTKMSKAQIKRLAIVIGLIMLAVFAVVILVWQSKTIGYICPTKKYLDIECPGCGGTRMVLSILQGDIYQAFRYNPFIMITLPIIFVIAIHQMFWFIIRGTFSPWLDKILVVYAVALFAFGILRNIEVFNFLKPTII